MSLLKYALILPAGLVVAFGSLFVISNAQTGEKQTSERRTGELQQQITEPVNKTNDYKITGRVIDENNQPVVSARVHSHVTDRPGVGRILFSSTNSKGEFVIGDIEPGPNAVYAGKEEDDYADTMFGFMATSEPPIVTVDEQHPDVQVEIKLGTKSPRLTGKITDARTKKPVADTGLRMCRTDNPQNCLLTSISADGTFNLLVTTVPFTLKALSPTHKDWEYKNGTGNEAGLLALTLDAPQELNIALEPK